MTAPAKTVWQLDAHTRAKHEILRRYLEAWTAILGLGGFRTIVYVDGFAGPGIYDNGEDGSPIIALKAALRHQARISAELRFLFIEHDRKRAAQLDACVSALVLPDRFKVRIVEGMTFEQGFRAHLLERYRSAQKPLPPTFAFIDPFGWTGVPFALVKEILANKSCEVLFNFMYEEINRFIEHPDQARNFDDLFGTADWRGVSRIADPRARREFLHGLYVRQLREQAGARHVRSVEMRNKKDATDYFLFFATNSPKGMEKMKEAMWKVDESGEFRFSDATNPRQTLLFSPRPDFDALRRSIVDQFQGKEVTVAEIEDFVLASTPFRPTHYKKQVLAELEREGKLTPVNPRPGRKTRSFGDPSMKVRFEGRDP
jgi:three-Cys-motif partner protein